MKKRLVVSSDQPPSPSALATRGVELSGAIRTRQLIAAEDTHGLSLQRQELAPGARIAVRGAAEEHVFYALKGEARVGEAILPAKGAVLVGAGGEAELTAGPEGAVLLHFQGEAASRPDKPGGCVHVLDERGLHCSDGEYARVFFAVSECPHCSVWLHSLRMKARPDAGGEDAPHRHSEDEIIYVLEGGMNLGTTALREGDAISIPGDAFYSFKAAADGLDFLNFRQLEPFVQTHGMAKDAWYSEREIMRAEVAGMSWAEMVDGGISVTVR